MSHDSRPPSPTPCLQEALDRADQELAYHGKRMDKRLRKLKNLPPPAFEDEPNTGVFSLPDPFPPPGKA